MFHPRDKIWSTLEMEIDAEVWETLKDPENGIFMDFHVVLFYLLNWVH